MTMTVLLPNDADFVQLLLEKLSTEERCIAMPEIARQIIDQLVLLNDVVAVEGENGNRIDLLAYSKMATHLLLLNHDFILSHPTVFDSLDAGTMEYQYTFRYQTEFVFLVDYKVVDSENVRVIVSRKLNNIFQDGVPMWFHELPQFSEESALNDGYKTEKVLVAFLKKICKLWTKL
ncbi:uncharacterized protein LOC135844015 isoform X2 [Planococcus citri]|uniref:uncharacterized protein LOC135844015 isoform X2 n=1 Tax=Planococcus citri TaxID=170843 RepID=UPI0031F90FAA